MSTLRLLRLEHPVHDLYSSLRARGAAPLPLPAAAPSHELLHRADWQIHCEAHAQTPPQGYTAIEAWLKAGEYKSWQCEPAVHAARSPSPHGFNRICSNDLISANATGTASWLRGAAAVKELLASANDTEPVGYAVYSKTESDSDQGAGWYWYERVPADHPAPHDSNGVVADGPGDDGPEKMICVSCHAAAGSDDAHTPSAGSRDPVYTPVE